MSSANVAIASVECNSRLISASVRRASSAAASSLSFRSLCSRMLLSVRMWLRSCSMIVRSKSRVLRRGAARRRSLSLS